VDPAPSEAANQVDLATLPEIRYYAISDA